MMRAAGVGALSATESGVGVCSVAVSILTAPSAEPARPLQVAAGSPVIPVADAADAHDINVTSEAANAHARA